MKEWIPATESAVKIENHLSNALPQCVSQDPKGKAETTLVFKKEQIQCGVRCPGFGEAGEQRV